MKHRLPHAPVRRRLLTGIATAILSSFAMLVPTHTALASESAANRILIGNTSALSGPLASLSQEYVGGARLYFARTNRDGGLGGK